MVDLDKLKPVPAESRLKATPFNFTEVVPRRKNMLPAAFKLDWGAYSAESTTLARPLIEEAAVQAGVASKPPYFHMSKLEGDSTDVAARPAEQNGPSALPVRWLEGGAKASVNLSRLLSVRPFSIPEHTCAIIPITQQVVENLGLCIVFHFSQAQFRPIEVGKRKKAKALKAQKAEKAKEAAAEKKPTNEVAAAAELKP